MKNFKIYKNGKYDIKANLKLQARVRGMEMLEKVDAAFVRLYEL